MTRPLNIPRYIRGWFWEVCLVHFPVVNVLFVTLLVILFTMLISRTAEAKTANFTVGKASVWAIADSVGDRDASTFPDADPQALAKYMPSGKAPTAIMVFLVKIKNELILIDAGLGAPSGERASHLHDSLKFIGISPEQITMVLITHMHPDHIGGLLRPDKSDEKAFPSARVLSPRIEHDFWLDDESSMLFPSRAAGFEMARKIFGIYRSASETFEFGAVVAPGIRAIDARGHTPGNALFMLESESERLLFWGDTLHAAALQFPRPDINAHFDMDPKESAAARVRFMEMAAKEKLPIAGTHLPFPGIGTVEKSSESGYIFTAN